jgi:hypothetical protein
MILDRRFPSLFETRELSEFLQVTRVLKVSCGTSGRASGAPFFLFAVFRVTIVTKSQQY